MELCEPLCDSLQLHCSLRLVLDTHEGLAGVILVLFVFVLLFVLLASSVVAHHLHLSILGQQLLREAFRGDQHRMLSKS